MLTPCPWSESSRPVPSSTSDRREHALSLAAAAARAGDDEALADAIRCAPVGVLSRWERHLLSMIPVLSAANVAIVQERVAVGVREADDYAAVLSELGWTLAQVDRSVITIGAMTGPSWGTPDGRDGAVAAVG